MLEQLLMHLHNWFVKDIYEDTFEIRGGALALPFVSNGQYYRIVGSLFNDGLHRYGDLDDILTDEIFEGAVMALAIPKAVVGLADEIAEWCKRNETASPYISESFAGYSYTRATGKSGNAVTWQDAFANQLNAWRKI